MKNMTDIGKCNDSTLVWLLETLISKQSITFLGNSYIETQI